MMMKKTSKNAISLVVVLAFGLTGCATMSVDELALPETDIADTRYEVKKDDRLSDIALRLTGEVSNWQIIAARNNISDPRTLAIGTVLIIPRELSENKAPVAAMDTENTREIVDINDSSSRQISDGQLSEVAIHSNESGIESDSDLAGYSNAARTASAPPVTTGAGVSVLLNRSTQDSNAAKDAADITVSAVTINRTFDLQPIEQSLESNQTEQRYDSDAPQIRVTGTYYPKAVYEQPASYSRLIERAAPGTLFDLDNEINDWYKIITDQGIGYIRSSDSAIVR